MTQKPMSLQDQAQRALDDIRAVSKAVAGHKQIGAAEIATLNSAYGTLSDTVYRMNKAREYAGGLIGCRCSVDDCGPGDCWPCRMMTLIGYLDDAEDQAIIDGPDAVDVDGLKASTTDCYNGSDWANGYNTAIDHLASRNLIRGKGE